MIIITDIESNCSENISNRDELTATEQREKNDCATEQLIDSSTEYRNIGKRPFEEAHKPESPLRRQRSEALADEEQQEWELLDELASYANKYLQKFAQDKNLKLVSAIFYQSFIFHQMIALEKLRKMFSISSKKLFSFSRYSYFCIFVFPSFFPCQPLF